MFYLSFDRIFLLKLKLFVTNINCMVFKGASQNIQRTIVFTIPISSYVTGFCQNMGAKFCLKMVIKSKTSHVTITPSRLC